MHRRAMRVALVLALAGSAAACSDLHLSASNLEIGPNPAVPGDVVQATFVLGLVPSQAHTIIFIIDDAEHLRITSGGRESGVVILDVGAAEDLITSYGAGEHRAHVQVHVGDEVTRTQSVPFELSAGEPTP